MPAKFIRDQLMNDPKSTIAAKPEAGSFLRSGPLGPLYRIARNALGLNHARLFMGYGVRARITRPWQPVGGGMAIHRYYTEEFLKTFSDDIRGYCLEFGEDSYSSRFGGGKIDKLEILNVEESAPGSTIIADLTKPNHIPSDQFDCITCTFVLHCIWDYVAALRDMRRILKPGGVLLGCVPFVMGYAANCGEGCRFSPEALDRLLEEAFGPGAAEIHLYGNSLAATADVRGLGVGKFKKEELDYADPRYPVLIAFRAVKR